MSTGRIQRNGVDRAIFDVGLRLQKKAATRSKKEPTRGVDEVHTKRFHRLTSPLSQECLQEVWLLGLILMVDDKPSRINHFNQLQKNGITKQTYAGTNARKSLLE